MKTAFRLNTFRMVVAAVLSSGGASQPLSAAATPKAYISVSNQIGFVGPGASLSAGSRVVYVSFSATDSDRNLTGIRPNIWHPSTGYFFNNNSQMVPVTGGAPDVSFPVVIDKEGEWYFWTDATDSTGRYASSGPWTGGHRIIATARQKPLTMDVDNDGYIDEIVPDGPLFSANILYSYPRCYPTISYDANAWWIQSFLSWPNGDSRYGFNLRWVPAISFNCFPVFVTAANMQTYPGDRYAVFRDNTSSGVANFANYTKIWEGTANASATLIQLGSYSGELVNNRFFQVRYGKPPTVLGLEALRDHGYSMEEFFWHSVRRYWGTSSSAAGDVLTEPPPVEIPPDDSPGSLPEGFDPLDPLVEKVARDRQGTPDSGEDPENGQSALSIQQWLIVVYLLQEVIDQWPVSYVTYGKRIFDPLRGKNVYYIGRTHGWSDPETVMRRRDAKHIRLRALKYADAELHSYATSLGFSFYCWAAHRGREQQVMDNFRYYHDRLSPENRRRGVGVANRMRQAYYQASNVLWPVLWFLTGDTPGSHSGDYLGPLFPDTTLYVPAATIQPLQYQFPWF